MSFNFIFLLIVTFTITADECNAQPKPRHLEEISFDFQRDKLIVFGGSEIHVDGFTDPTGVFELGSEGWVQINANGPVGRRGHAMIYHKRDKLTYLFAGVTVTIKDSLLFDTWSWDGVAWQQLDIQCPVKNPAGVFDSRNNSILIYGDASDKQREAYGDEQVFQLWQFKDHNWNLISDSGPRPEGPYEMSFDVKRATVVIPVWNNGKLVVWEWAGNTWRQISCTSECPPARNRFGLTYSSSEGLTYLFGGRDPLDRNKFLADFWSWDGSRWKRVRSGDVPSARAGLCLEDSSSGIILYGGVVFNDGKSEVTNELWRWDGESWSK